MSVSEITSTLYLVIASHLSCFLHDPSGEDVGVVVVAVLMVTASVVGMVVGSRLYFLRLG